MNLINRLMDPQEPDIIDREVFNRAQPQPAYTGLTHGRTFQGLLNPHTSRIQTYNTPPLYSVSLPESCRMLTKDQLREFVMEKIQNSFMRSDRRDSPESIANSMLGYIISRQPLAQIFDMPVSALSLFYSKYLDYYVSQCQEFLSSCKISSRMEVLRTLRQTTAVKLASLVKLIKVVANKSIREIQNFQGYAKSNSLFEMAGVFLNKEDLRDYTEAKKEMLQILEDWRNKIEGWIEQMKRIHKARTEIMVGSDIIAEKHRHERLANMDFHRAAEFKVQFANPDSIVNFGTMQSLTEGYHVSTVFMQLYLNFLQRRFGVNDLYGDRYILSVTQTISFFQNPAQFCAHNFKNKMALFENYQKIGFILHYNSKQYGFAIYHGNSNLVVVYDSAEHQMQQYDRIRCKIGNYLNCERDQKRNDKNRNCELPELKVVTLKQSLENSGIWTLINMTWFALKAIPQNNQVPIGSTTITDFRSKLSEFLRYLAYCAYEKEPRYPNMDFLESCSVDYLLPSRQKSN